jgi:hypothetical protein
MDLDWARRHFIHHRACSYFVIPSIYSVDPADKEEQLRALAINQLAGVLDDLNLIRVLSPHELKKLAMAETRGSFADLLPLRTQHDRERTQPGNGQLGWKDWAVAKAGITGLANDENRLRYHGLLSKAQRLLEIAGWSEAARRDAEVYRLVDCDGLTPLLALFSEATLAKGAESIALARADDQALQAQPTLRLEDQGNHETAAI